jgi:hypothetical protein
MKVKIKHSDGVTDVMANVFICDSREVTLDYRLDGMDYCVSLTLPQAINMGIVKKVKASNSFRDMVKGEIYPIIKTYLMEDSIACSKGDMIIDIGCGEFNYSNFYAAN